MSKFPKNQYIFPKSGNLQKFSYIPIYPLLPKFTAQNCKNDLPKPTFMAVR